MTQPYSHPSAPWGINWSPEVAPRRRNRYRPLRDSIATPADDSAEETGSVDMATELNDRLPTTPPRRPLRVVIVEDEAIISMELEMLLEDLNAVVVGTAMSAEEAEACVAALNPDCVTMDINIKGDRDGVLAARDIFEKYGVRSIFVTAYGDAQTRERAEAAYPIGWIRKPIEKEELGELLSKVERRDI